MDTKALRQKILDLAIRGKLVPQDPNDEPASVLLERIREEKKQMVKDGKLKPKDIKNDTIIFKGEDNLHYEKFQDGTVKCIEDEIPFEVPEGWEWCRYRNVIDLYSGQDLVPDRYNSEHRGIPYITGASNLDNGHIILNRWTDSPTTHATINDLLLTCKGSGVGKMAICNIEDVHIARQIMALRCTSAINVLYLQVAVTSTIDEIKQLANGIIPGITREVVLSTLMPLPPYREQCNIGEKVGAVCELIDNVEDEKIALSDVISATKDKVLDLAIRGQLVPQDTDDESASVLLERIREEKENLIKKGKLKRDKKESIIYKGDDNSYYEKFNDGTLKCIDNEIPYAIPLNWEWCRLGSIGNWQSGATPSRRHPEYYGGDIPWLKTGDLNDEYIDDVSEYITDEGFKNSSVVMNPIGSVLIAMYGATIGKLGITNIETTTNQACCACFPLMISNKYLFFFLMHEKENFIKNAVGGAQPNISKEKIVGTLIPIPPLDEQNRIVKTIESLNGFLSLIEASLI